MGGVGACMLRTRACVFVFVPNSPHALSCLRSLTNGAWSFLLAWLYTRSFLVLLIMLPSGVRMWHHFMLFL